MWNIQQKEPNRSSITPGVGQIVNIIDRSKSIMFCFRMSRSSTLDSFCRREGCVLCEDDHRSSDCSYQKTLTMGHSVISQMVGRRGHQNQNHTSSPNSSILKTGLKRIYTNYSRGGTYDCPMSL